MEETIGASAGKRFIGWILIGIFKRKEYTNINTPTSIQTEGVISHRVDSNLVESIDQKD